MSPSTPFEDSDQIDSYDYVAGRCPTSAGEQLKRNGQKQALDHSGSVWLSKVMDTMRFWLVLRKSRDEPLFRFEELRAYCEQFHDLIPASHFAWGALPRVAVRAGLIEFTDKYVKAESPKTHSHPVKQWRAL